MSEADQGLTRKIRQKNSSSHVVVSDSDYSKLLILDEVCAFFSWRSREVVVETVMNGRWKDLAWFRYQYSHWSKQEVDPTFQISKLWYAFKISNLTYDHDVRDAVIRVSTGKYHSRGEFSVAMRSEWHDAGWQSTANNFPQAKASQK